MGSLAVIRGPQTVEAWLACFPELVGRPQLLAEMTAPTRQAVSFRGALFKRLEAIHQVPFIPDDSVARHVLNLTYQHDKASFVESWEGRAEKRAMCQAVSAIKDAHRASLWEIDDREREARGKPPIGRRAIPSAPAAPPTPRPGAPGSPGPTGG